MTRSSETLVSHDVYVVVVSAMVIGLATAWIIVDVYRMWRDISSGYDGADRGDRLFGYVVGITIGVLGCIGAAMYHVDL